MSQGKKKRHSNEQDKQEVNLMLTTSLPDIKKGSRQEHSDVSEESPRLPKPKKKLSEEENSLLKKLENISRSPDNQRPQSTPTISTRGSVSAPISLK